MATLNRTEPYFDLTTGHEEEANTGIDIMMILSTFIASFGMIANFNVIIVFLTHKKLRSKIPNRFIVNQVINNFWIEKLKRVTIRIGLNHLHNLFFNQHLLNCINQLHDVCQF